MVREAEHLSRLEIGRRCVGGAIAVVLALALPAGGAGAVCVDSEATRAWVQAVQDARARDSTDELLRLYKEHARTGDSRMQADLGFLFEDGAGRFPSESVRARTALKLFESAALCGDHLAIRRLALAYQFGELGLAPDPATAACLYEIELSGRSAAVCGIGTSY